MELNTQAQQREAVAQGRSLSPYRLRYNILFRLPRLCGVSFSMTKIKLRNGVGI
ncbi:MAG: hypothetical protein LBJ00_04500 [Planctomycetaceae bacterium]|nr:hypothetical protein [Planctomycetaceae bacterium]